MADTLELDILTPDGRVDLRVGEGGGGSAGDGPIEVEGVEVPAALGEMGVRPRHVPFLTPVLPGVVRFKYDGESRRVAIGRGFLEIGDGGAVTILTSHAVRSWEIDADTVAAARDEVVESLGEFAKAALDDAEAVKLRQERDWLEAQLRAAQA